MEEKRYPLIESDGQAGMVSESLNAVACHHQKDAFQDEVPYSGPATWEELMEEFDHSERQIETEEGLPWESVKQIMAGRISNHAGQIH